ncbi:SDR family NAD(P)-dependent oxidoreductase [Kribbella sp. DT2]|uniref:SDR family NAD(P)-dependent oxidoreductase n=1 Tax=Kribbella sp. DT2 TaxID=3393427 RepID=UPI003CEB9E54
MSGTALLVGGSSEIGFAVLKELLGPPPRRVVLAGRPSEELWKNAEALRDVGYYVTTAQYDATLHAEEIDGLLTHLSAEFPVDLAVVAVGTMQERSFTDGLIVNGLAVSLLLRALVRRLSGTAQLVLISSAAAARPRSAIAAYSLGKQLADSTAVLLAPQAARDGVRVLVVRPGFVRTRMTADLPRPPLATTPEQVGRRVARALRGRRVVVWAPPTMAVVVWVLRLLPARLVPPALR